MNLLNESGGIKDTEELYQAYKKLLDSAKAINDQIAVLVPKLGKDYRVGNGCMLVGRATNGWEEPNADSSQEFDGSLNGFCWMKKAREDKKYNALAKPFWNYGLRCFEDDELPALKKTVWTNLFPGPVSRGNPDENLKKQVRENAKAFLRAEIEYFRPSRILILSEMLSQDCSTWYDEAKWFFDENHEPFLQLENKRKQEQPGPVRLAGKYKDIATVVVACRPEFRHRDWFTEKVKEAFNSLD